MRGCCVVDLVFYAVSNSNERIVRRAFIKQMVSSLHCFGCQIRECQVCVAYMCCFVGTSQPVIGKVFLFDREGRWSEGQATAAASPPNPPLTSWSTPWRITGPFSNTGVSAGVNGRSRPTTASLADRAWCCLSLFLGCGGNTICFPARSMSLSASPIKQGSHSGRIL